VNVHGNARVCLAQHFCAGLQAAIRKCLNAHVSNGRFFDYLAVRPQHPHSGVELRQAVPCVRDTNDIVRRRQQHEQLRRHRGFDLRANQVRPLARMQVVKVRRLAVEIGELRHHDQPVNFTCRLYRAGTRSRTIVTSACSALTETRTSSSGRAVETRS